MILILFVIVFVLIHIPFFIMLYKIDKNEKEYQARKEKEMFYRSGYRHSRYFMNRRL